MVFGDRIGIYLVHCDGCLALDRIIMARRIAIWVLGLLASGIFGSMIGQQLEYMDGGIWGFLVGAFAFVCIRL